ncbi:proprotein convertase subtilisin/kexin type 7-like [Actinia tenebrosa]|uniref:Proprotein convertase subtilisin/kexin type 7-like n=1 Tax=Actinia tenebrosa TaxID=6105 RepID=A0A6P8HG87_ACTTE|nr:proprotein convertase subtilisin/kexin type 7-like [Actinia tenebrosa]
MLIKLQIWRIFTHFVAVVLISCFVESQFEENFIASSSFLPIYNDSAAMASSSWAVRIPFYSHMDEKDLHFLADKIAHEAGLYNMGQIGGLKRHYLFYHKSFKNDSKQHSTETARIRHSVTELLGNHPHVEWFKQEVVRKRYKRGLQFQDQYFPNQWHLDNLRYVGNDINVTGVWENNITGQGVVVSVIDDGVEWTNPDILDNYSSEGSWDINSNDPDPMPRADDAGLNHHGTRCAGEIAAVPNTYCAVGVAYGAKVSGVRILDGPMTDSLEAMAFNTKLHINDIYSCSWGPDDNGKTVDGPHQLAQAALAHGVLAGRHGYGSIFVVASGNGGHFKDNCNFDGYANSIYTVTIGAVDEVGDMPYYAEHCAAMLAVTYSSGQGMQRNIVTTDWRLGTGTGCTDKHTGTSAAAPLAAGMIALMMQARPCLTWRDVQHVIAMSAFKHSVDDDDYHTNNAGYHHSHKYGFGVLDSWRLVTTAQMWKSVPWMTSWSSPVIHVNRAIPSTNKMTESYRVTREQVAEVVTLEHVTVTVNLRHRYRGNLIVKLVSPHGTPSMLATARRHDRSPEGFVDWTFSTVRCWGETPEGVWTLIVIDNGNDHARGYLMDWKITLYGSALSPADIKQRRSIMEEGISGKYLHTDKAPPCPPPPSSVKSQEIMSERMLKVLLLFSGFCFLIAIYYVLDVVFDNEGLGPPQPVEEKVENKEPSPLIPAKLAEEDWKRLSNLLESGEKNTRPSSTNQTSQRKGFQSSPSYSSNSNQNNPALPSQPSSTVIPTDTVVPIESKTSSSRTFFGKRRVLSPSDEVRRVKDFEKRLRYAMEQSLKLQTKQLKDIDELENELQQATEESLIAHALEQRFYNSISHTPPPESTNINKPTKIRQSNASAGRSIRKPIKGILKKSKSYLSSSR